LIIITDILKGFYHLIHVSLTFAKAELVKAAMQ